MPKQDRDVESRKIRAVRSDALDQIVHSIRRSLEDAIAAGVDLDDFEWRLRRKIKNKKGKMKRVEYGSYWAAASHLIDSFYLPEIDAAEGREAVIANG
jgi:hypothetical protein